MKTAPALSLRKRCLGLEWYTKWAASVGKYGRLCKNHCTGRSKDTRAWIANEGTKFSAGAMLDDIPAAIHRTMIKEMPSGLLPEHHLRCRYSLVRGGGRLIGFHGALRNEPTCDNANCRGNLYGRWRWHGLYLCGEVQRICIA